MTRSKLQLENGLLTGVRFCPSPHHDARPPEMLVDMVVVHGISLPPGQFGGDDIEDFFCGNLDFNSHADYAAISHLRVSAHLLIKRNGEIIQFVPFDKRAWHAGESLFDGRTCCNDFSVGIELEGTDDIPYEQVQYEKLAEVIRVLMQYYPAITRERVVGHADIAPGRKLDPGPAFDWKFLKGKIA